MFINLCHCRVQIIITLTGGALLIFGIEKLLAWPGIEPTTLDLSLQLVFCDKSINFSIASQEAFFSHIAYVF